MVGDGINDAEALAVADVGIAMVSPQSHLAAEAGDVLLLSNRLSALPGLVRLSRALVRNIRQSILLFAFGLNALGMLLSGAGILSPVWAAVFHEAGSLAVMLNALRLLWFEPGPQAFAGRFVSQSALFAKWLTESLSPSRWVYRVVDHWNILLRLAVTAMACGWLASNVAFLTHDEKALVTRFGKVHAQLEAGWHWRWPAPFERIYRTRPDHIRSLTYGFRFAPLPDGQSRPSMIDWTSPHEKAGEVPVPEESLLLTADEVPVELTALVHYRISDLREFHFGNADPEESLRALTGQTLRSLAAATSLDEILTTGRAELEQRSRDHLKLRSEAHQLGLEIVAVELGEVHPPRGVVPAYRDVANAMEEEELLKNQGQAAAISRLLETAGPRALGRLEAELNWDAESSQETPQPLSIENWRDLAKTETGPEGERLLFLAGETASILLKAQGQAAKEREAAQGEAERFRKFLPIYREHPELTSLEMYWKTLEAVLPSQPLMILDPKAQGRRHLMIADPEWAGFPVPPLSLDTSPMPDPEPKVR
jgi:Cu+-exporting ATPase